MDQRKNASISENIFRNQPIMCPWITSQPYLSAHLNKNRNSALNNTSINNHQWPNVPISVDASKSHDKPCPSMQQSSSQFFYFLRLMQIFPDTHPATLHTVLTLCKNDFFCAVDKLLYAKRCKLLYNRRFQKSASNRNNPYCNFNSNVCGSGKTTLHQEDSNPNVSVLKNVEKQKKCEEFPDFVAEQNVSEDTSIVKGETRVELENKIDSDSNVQCSSTIWQALDNPEDLSSTVQLKENDNSNI